MTTRQKLDLKSPQAAVLRDQIRRGAFVSEGTMIAFPTCFPGASIPIPLDESRLSALSLAEDGSVYGGTGGRAVHLFMARFAPVTGVAFDLGVVEGATHCAAVGCGKSKLVACVNGPAGGRVVQTALQEIRNDCIQEWGFLREPIVDLGGVAAGEPIVHAVPDASRTALVGATTSHLFRVDLAGGKIDVIAEMPGHGRLVADGEGNVWGFDSPACLWKYHVAGGALTRRAVELPAGAWTLPAPVWARGNGDCPLSRRLGKETVPAFEPTRQRLYFADAEGRLFCLDRGQARGPLAQAKLAPITALAVTFDGRLFGFCGEGISRLFCFDPAAGTLRDLGAAVSTIQSRRYGYAFADAVTGTEGQIYFAEHDDGGHLWMYFPRIQPTETGD